MSNGTLNLLLELKWMQMNGQRCVLSCQDENINDLGTTWPAAVDVFVSRSATGHADAADHWHYGHDLAERRPRLKVCVDHW